MPSRFVRHKIGDPHGSRMDRSNIGAIKANSSASKVW
jgi:hypothetical protein